MTLKAQQSSREGGDRGSLWYRYQLTRYQVPPKLKALVPPILGAGAINIVKLIMNMMDSERRSTSVPREINGQDKTTPEHVTVASVSLSALLKAKNSFYKSQNHLWMKFLLVPSHQSYNLGTGTPTFGTRFHHICTMLYQVPPLWYHGTTTLSPPSQDHGHGVVSFAGLYSFLDLLIITINFFMILCIHSILLANVKQRTKDCHIWMINAF